MKSSKPYILIATIVLIAGIIYFINAKGVSKTGQEALEVIPRKVSEQNENKKEDLPAGRQEKLKHYELAKEITTPDGFINTSSTSSGQATPVTIGEFVGKKVILVDFWTYSCINCQRTTPYLNAWYEKYKDKGLVIIGIHTPEFEFEKDYKNVKTAVEKLGIKYPVVLDNDYSTWTAYKNQYWPRKYLIDIDGYIVYDHIGEGGYDETEKEIQKLLEERMITLGMNEEIVKDISSPTSLLGPDINQPRSPETYFGASRNIYLGNGKSGTIGFQSFPEPVNIKTSILYLSGDWDFRDEFAENKSSRAKIVFRYQARNVYFVAGGEKNINIKVFKDGKFVGEQTINAHTLYDIVRGKEYGEHTLEIIIENPGLRAFTFTFG